VARKKKKEKKKGFWSKLAESQITKSYSIQDGSALFLLSEKELRVLKEIKKRTFIKAGIAGALGVIVLYIPYHWFGETIFPIREIPIPQNPFYNGIVPIEIEFIVYSVVLVMIEIWYLTYINIQAVSGIAHVCGHPNPTDENYESNLEALIAVGLERKQKQLKGIGINPYEGLNKVGVVIFQFLLRLKATASNMIFRIIMKRALGRFALRLVLDMLGIPVYAFWNIWGSRKVINEARIRVMAPPLIKRCSELLWDEQKDNPEFAKHIYDSLQLISESKRSFHYNHFLLSITMLNKFDIEIREEPVYNDKFLSEIAGLSELTRCGVQKLFVFGIMIDGRISVRERKAIKYLINQGVLRYTEEQIQGWADDYFDGKGIEEFFAMG
jgi:hypothetical protein